MSDIAEVLSEPALETPTMIVALDGWIDAGLGAATALEAILEQTDSETVVRFDTDELLDHRSRRPTMVLDDGVNTELVWPALELRAARDLDGRDLLLLVGAEPDHRWRAVVSEVISQARAHDVRMVMSDLQRRYTEGQREVRTQSMTVIRGVRVQRDEARRMVV